jgi:hypothetical protein
VDLALANFVKNTQQFLAEFWTPADRQKVQSMPHTNVVTLRPSIAMEWDWLTV